MSANLAPLADLPRLEVDPTSYDESSLIVKLRSQPDTGTRGHGLPGPTPAVNAVPLGFNLQKIELMAGVSAHSVLGEFGSSPDNLYAELDYRVQIATIPDDPRFAEQWGLHNTGQLGGSLDADIDAPDAWDVTTGTGSTVVAVIDTGVDYGHPDLAARMWINTGEIPGDGIDNDNNGYIDDIYGYDFFNGDADPRDDHNHGTHVAGTIGAQTNNGVGVAGINWNVQIMALKFLGADGSGSTSDAIAALNYAVENGAQISNNSWGGGPFSQALYDAVNEARDHGHIFVAAAGNGNAFGIGQDNDTTPFYPASFDLDNVVTVAATDRNDQIAVFSNFGSSSVDIGAPGVDILSTTIQGGYGNSSGTSMAAPHVSGALSLLRDFDPTLSYQQLIDRVLLSADPVDALQGITVTGGRLNLAAALIPDTLGPRVTDAQPSGLILDPVDRLRLSFNEAIDTATFTIADIEQFLGPQGDVNVSSVDPVAGSNGRQFDLVFPSQSVAGTYQLVLRPEIFDRFGNAMDQNENGIGGEDPGDRWTHEFVLADAVARLDFGTATSPVAANYARVTHADSYSESVGRGWQSGAVYSLNRGGDALTGDHNYTKDATFAMDVPNGEYDVIVTLGEGLIPHDQMGVFLEGVHVDTVTTAANEFAVNTYRTSVADGQLTLGLTDLGGSDSWVMINALDVVFAGPDQTGPQVIATDASGTVSGPIDRIQLTFNEPIDPSTFTLEDVAVLEGPDGTIAPIAVQSLGTGEFEVTFEPQNTPGIYRLVIGPEITDIAGNPMDQNGNGISGEPLADQFETLFTLEPGPVHVARFDYGTSLSPVADGYTRVIHTDRYSEAIGHGWQTGLVYSLNRGGNALTRDHNYTKDATFALDLPNGEYDVIVTLGEALIPHDQMGVFLEGVHVDTVTTAANEFAVNTYRTSVADGQLTLGLTDLGGSDSWVMINGLEVIYVGPDENGPQVIATDASGTVSGPIDRIKLTFNEPIDSSTFTLDDVAVLEGPAGTIAPTAVQPLGTGEFEITFEPQNTPGIYRLVVGPEITDIAGNPMDQNGNGISGEPLADQFEMIFTLEPGPVHVARFDYGTALSPVADGYTRVIHTDRYSEAIGHGWQTGLVYSLNRGGDALTRDHNYTKDATFALDLPNGEYDVVVTLGEALIPHDQMGVFLEGVHVDTVTTAANEFAVNTYRTSVADGQLTLGLTDLGGSDSWVMINGLEVIALDSAANLDADTVDSLFSGNDFWKET